ncbi:hypothetical protein ACHAP5_010876 [Fusarium lateritium]
MASSGGHVLQGQIPDEAQVESSDDAIIDTTVHLPCLVPESFNKTFDTCSHFALLWKICLHIFRIDPYSLFSPLRGLHADTTLGYYDQAFSLELCRLVTHGVFARSPKRLALLLQFAVICRTDDRRHWTPPFTHGVRVLRLLRENLATYEEPLPFSISDILNDYLPIRNHSRSIEENPAYTVEGPPYEWSCEILPTLMSHLSCIAREKGSMDASGLNVTIYKGFDVYSVSTIDLQNIRKAIDIISLFKSPKNDLSFSVQSYFDMYKSRMHLDDYAPRDRDQLKKFMKSSSRENHEKVFNAHRLVGL